MPLARSRPANKDRNIIAGLAATTDQDVQLTAKEQAIMSTFSKKEPPRPATSAFQFMLPSSALRSSFFHHSSTPAFQFLILLAFSSGTGVSAQLRPQLQKKV